MRKQIAVLTCLTWVCGLCLAKPGVWHGVDDKTGNTAFYLYLAGPDSRLFSPEWIEVPGPEIEGSGFQFRLPYKSYGMKCEGKLTEGKIRGTWKIHQVQWEMKGTWTARRVFDAEKWSPSGFMQSGKDVDIVSRLDRDFEDYKAFQAYWDREIEPEFFVLLTETLYADAEGDFRPHLKQESLKQVYDSLRSTERFSAFGSKVLPGVTEARKRLIEDYPWIASDIAVVSTFSLGSFDYRLQKVANRYLLLFGVDWIAKNLDEKEVVRLAGEGLVASFHFRTLHLGTRGRYEVVRRGIATYLLDRLNQPEFHYRIHGEGDGEPSLIESMKRVKEHLSDGFEDFYAATLTGEIRTETYQVLLKFGQSLAQDAGEPSKLFRLTVDELKKALRVFMAEVPVDKPKEETPQVVESH